MGMRRWAALALALALALAGAALGETRLMVVSDIHYLAPELREDSPLFLRVLRAGDGKIAQHGDALLDALADTAARERPDALIVTGDLSFNGERASHEALARRFAAIEAAGTPVWVIPGNHDINSPKPVGFSGEAWHDVEGVTPEAFSAIYADFLGPPAAGANLSYTFDAGPLRVAMADVAFYEGMGQTFGVFTDGHRRWLEAALKDARRDGATAITATHHSLLAHTEFSRDSFLMLGSEAMAALARQYGVALNLSGHLHVQHIARADGLADAALGAFCLWPHRYAIVTLDDSGALRYAAKSLDADALPEGFPDMSRAWFEDIARDKAAASLAEQGLPDEAVSAMADFAARFNLAYFSGTYRSDDPAWRADPAFELWRGAGGVFGQYLTMVMDEPNGNNITWRSRA